MLLKNAVTEFKVPIVVGLNIYEAREDLEELGLRVTEKLESPSPNFVNKGDGQVTKLTFPNGQKVGSKLKTGDRIFLYYVNDEVIFESKSLKDKNEKTSNLIDFVNKSPDKFNKLIADKNIVTKALIETLIVRGELIRAEYNQQISSADGNFIGSNMNEAVAYFNNPNNKDIRTAYENKLKMTRFYLFN